MKKLLLVLLAITLFTACPSPQPPPPPDPNITTTIDEQGKLLTAAINAGCAFNRTYIAFDKYWILGEAFIPPDIKAKAIFAANVLHKALNTYNSGVIIWENRKNEPENWQVTTDELIKAYNDAVPLIKEIIALINKKSQDGTLKSAGKAVTFEGTFDCTFVQFKDYADKVSKLPDIK